MCQCPHVRGAQDTDMEELDDSPLPVQTYKEAVESLEDVQEFLYSRGHVREAMEIGLSGLCRYFGVTALSLNQAKHTK